MKYAKAVAATFVFLGVVGTALQDGSVSTPELASILTAAAGVYAVWRVPNKQPPTP